MTTYQNSWNQEIKDLLLVLKAPESLFENIVESLHNSKRTEIFENQVINALRIALSVKEGNLNIAFIAPMQSGKSGTIYFLCNYVLPALGLIKENETVLFVTSMRDTDLYRQNCQNLEKDYYDASEKCMMMSKIKVMKMSDFFNSPNPHKVVNDLDVQFIVRDEDQYGCGEESSFQTAFFIELRKRISNIKLLAVSATPYDILDAHFTQNAIIDVVEGVRPPNYYGISEMLRDNIIEDLPEYFSALQKQTFGGEDLFSIHPKVEEYISFLLNFNQGLGIIRESTTARALELRKQIKKKFKRQCEVLAIGSDSSCDFSIEQGMKEVNQLVKRAKKNVVLIVVQALTAGKDLGLLKENIRFGIEPRSAQLANGSQGISGRFCGYYNNRNIKILASKVLLEEYSEFEMDWEVFNDENWRKNLYNSNVRGLSTQTKFLESQSESVYIPIVDSEEISVEELSTEQGREKLDFIDNDGYEKLLTFFEESFYQNGSKGVRFSQEGVTVRIASGYNQNSNRVYKNWNASIDDDFGNTFFKKTAYNNGILISNFPVDDQRNKINFCGIKIYKAGDRINRQQVVDVENKSMYYKMS
jgi:hypothetical protein